MPSNRVTNLRVTINPRRPNRAVPRVIGIEETFNNVKLADDLPDLMGRVDLIVNEPGQLTVTSISSKLTTVSVLKM